MIFGTLAQLHSLTYYIFFSAIQHDRDKIRYTKALKKKREEEKRLKEMVIKEDIGSPQSIASDTYINTSTPSSSTMINILENDHHSYDPEAQVYIIIVRASLCKNKISERCKSCYRRFITVRVKSEVT